MKHVYEENGTPVALSEIGRCPACNSDWCGDEIFDVLRKQDWTNGHSDEELRKYVENSYSPPHKFSRLVGVQLPHDHPGHYDGVSYYMCPDCRHKWPRFKHGTYRP